MTLSNNAIKFLQAQYRAIFKRAYVKGLATAVLLTAGLAAGQAQAASDQTSQFNETSWDSPADTVSLTSGDSVNLAANTDIFTNTLTGTGAVTVNGSGGRLVVKDSMTLTDADLTLTGTTNGAGIFGFTTYPVSTGEGAGQPLFDNPDKVTNFTATNSAIKITGTTQAIIFNNVTITNSADKVSSIASGSGIGADNGNVQGEGRGILTINGGTYNLSDNAFIYASQQVNIGEGTVINASGSGAEVYSYNSGVTNFAGTYNVASGDSAMLAGGTLNFQDGATINNSGTFTLGNPDASTKNTINLTAGTITNQGTLQIEGNTTIDGTTVSNTGTVVFNADTLNTTAEGFAGLFTKSGEKQGKLNFSGSAINVDGAVDLNGLGIINSSNGSLDSNRLGLKAEGATLTTDTVSLKGFYTADKLDLDVGTLNVEGTAQGGSSPQKIRFEMASGTTITVHDALTGSNEIEQFVIKATNTGETTSLILDAGANGGTITNIQNFHVGWDNSGSSVLTVKGTWDFGGSVIKAGSSGTVTIDGTANNVGELRLQQGGETTINGAMEIDRLLGSEADGGTLNINGTLTVTGDGTTETKNSDDEYRNDVYLTEATVNINNGGTFAITTADAVEDVIKVTTDTSTGEITAIEVPQSGSNTTEQGGWVKDNITLNAGGTLQVNLAALGIDTITQDNLSSLKESLVASGSKGSFDFGEGLTIELDDSLQTAIDSGEVSYGSLSSGGVNDVQGVADGVTVTVTASEASTGINLSNGASAVKLASGTNSVAVDGSLILEGTGGNFVYSEDAAGTQTVADVSVKANSGVNLTGAGTVGSLVKNGTDTGTSAVLTAGQGATQIVDGEINLDTVTIGAGTVNVADDVTATTLTLDGNLTNGVDTIVAGNTAKSITATTLTQNGGTLVTNNLTLGASGAASTTSELKGVVTADSITIQQSSSTAAGQGNVVHIINDSLVAADEFTAASGAVINVGTDGDGDSGSSSTGTLDVGTLNLNGATLTIDPIYGLGYASTIVSELSTNNTLDGSVNIGQNSILAVGFEDKAELDSFLAENKLLDSNGSLFAENGSLLIVNDTMTIADNYGVALDGTQTPITTAQDAITVNSGAAVVVTPDAFGGRDGNGELSGAYAIKFENSDNTNGSGSVTFSNGGKVLLAGAFSADDFADNNVQLFVAGTTGATAGTVTVTNGTDAVQSTNGVLKGSISADGKIQNVKIDDVAFDRNITHASAPVKELLYTAVDGSKVLDKSALGYEFLSYVGTQTNGQDAEAAARLATFGGVVQAGLMAAQTSADAVADRLGMANPNSALITSSNAQGGGLWIAPVYKNQDSDEFDAQGVDYGADIDLYGLALGADFTTESGVRVGALFNLGSGDADGQGVGSTVSNDFDYFGFTLYAGATFGNFALTADAGFTQLSNDLEQVSYMGTLKADTDTTVTSVGLRGEYLFATPWVDVVPHLGVRYTSLDMDSYDVHSDAGVLASTDADSMQVFSIPFGVTFSKDMVMGNWLVKPVFDLTLTANTGDDEIDSTTTFTGMQSVALSTEIMDSFTYGATLGINAQYQESISFGLNVGYTGSSSADEFGVNANARYTF